VFRKIKEPLFLFCLASGLLGLILIGFGVFLLVTGFFLDFITIGSILSGIILLLICVLIRKMKTLCLVCLLLTLITLFLIIGGVLVIILSLLTAFVTGLILIGLGILTLLLNVVCLILKICNIKICNIKCFKGVVSTS
jgi:hypothetical protein